MMPPIRRSWVIPAGCSQVFYILEYKNKLRGIDRE